MKSPCTGHCAINQQQICSGCGRTRSEISNWRTMNEQEKEEAALCAKDRLRLSSLQMRNKVGEDDK
jgi:predicted Fe-S protein YdhL (DUF1289 family)